MNQSFITPTKEKNVLMFPIPPIIKRKERKVQFELPIPVNYISIYDGDKEVKRRLF